MKRHPLLFTAICTLSILSAASGAERTGVVTVNILNVRNRPDAVAASVVAKLKRGETVRIIKQTGEWTEIVAPESTSVYVYAQFMADGKTTRDVNLRTGPGVEFQSYGIAPAGTELTAAGEEKNGWLKVKPLPTMSCFASARYIREEKPRTEEAAATAKTGVPAVAANEQKTETASGLPMPEVSTAGEPVSESDMKQLRSLFVENSGQSGEWEGRLILNKKSSLGALRFALIAPGKTIQPICHLTMTDLAPCSKLTGQTVKVKGIMYQVSGWKMPVVIADAIAPCGAQ